MSLVGTCLRARRCPALRWRELGSGSGTERGNLAPDTGPAVQLGEEPPGRQERGLQVAETTRGRVAMRGTGTDCPVVAVKVCNEAGAKGAGRLGSFSCQPPAGGMNS
jgi:hypothetical protein